MKYEKIAESIRRLKAIVTAGLHHRRDVALHEDATRMTVGDTGKAMALACSGKCGQVK